MQDERQPDQQADSRADVAEEAPAAEAQQRENLACPPGMDQEVFNSLPVEMQREVVEQDRVAAEVGGQLDSASIRVGLEALFKG